MKRYNSPLSVVAILFVLLFISIFLNFKFIGLVKAQRNTILSLQDNSNLYEYKEALRLADTIMNNNDVWDMDGSDVMLEYLNIRATMDSTYYKAIPNKTLLDNVSFLYDE